MATTTVSHSRLLKCPTFNPPHPDYESEKENIPIPIEQAVGSDTMPSIHNKRPKSATTPVANSEKSAKPKPTKGPKRIRKSVTGLEIERVLKLWNFDKKATEQSAEAIKLGHELLLFRKNIPPGGFASEADRATAVYIKLVNGLRSLLSFAGCEAIGYCKRDGKRVLVGVGSPLPRVPKFLQIPFIVLEEENPMANLLLGKVNTIPFKAE